MKKILRIKSVVMVAIALLSASIACNNALADAAPTVETPSITHTSPINDTYLNSIIDPSQFEQLPNTQQQTLAAQWHLSVADYDHYLWLMSNTPAGIYYKDKDLDPSWILGFNAKDEKERQKYVLIAIQNERIRVENELTFQNEFYALQKSLYPSEKPINTQAAMQDN
jgi:hypothetical protein